MSNKKNFSGNETVYDLKDKNLLKFNYHLLEMETTNYDLGEFSKEPEIVKCQVRN